MELEDCAQSTRGSIEFDVYLHWQHMKATHCSKKTKLKIVILIEHNKKKCLHSNLQRYSVVFPFYPQTKEIVFTSNLIRNTTRIVHNISVCTQR